MHRWGMCVLLDHWHQIAIAWRSFCERHMRAHTPVDVSLLVASSCPTVKPCQGLPAHAGDAPLAKPVSTRKRCSSATSASYVAASAHVTPQERKAPCASALLTDVAAFLVDAPGASTSCTHVPTKEII